MILRGTGCTLRPWRVDDVAALPAVAGDPDVVRYMNLRFPSPYTPADAEAWVRLRLEEPEMQHWAIEVGGELAGGIGVTPGVFEHAGSVMIGYWLGKRFWGRGIASDALRTLTAHVFAVMRPHRLWANVMSANAASARVLEKAGFAREAVLARAIVDRHGTVHDELIYARFPASAAS